MTQEPAPDALPCPCCKHRPQLFISAFGYVSYQCDNEACDLFPATTFFPKKEDAEKEWIEIARDKDFCEPDSVSSIK